MRPIDTVVIHWTATAAGWMAGSSVTAQRDEIADWHRARGFRDIGYHWVIGRDGIVVPGRPVSQTGAHVRGHNRRSIGIALIGGPEDVGPFAQHFTAAQESALISLLADLAALYRPRRICGHRDLAATQCPGFDVGLWLGAYGLGA